MEKIMSKTTMHNSKASLKVRELKDEELNGVVGGMDSARMSIKISPEYTKPTSTAGASAFHWLY
jgi:hypothetical protein